MAQPMLAVDLRHNQPPRAINLEAHASCRSVAQAPCAIVAGAQIESQGNSGTARLADISAKVEAVPRIEATLVSLARALVEHVREAYRMQQGGRREAQQNSPLG